MARLRAAPGVAAVLAAAAPMLSGGSGVDPTTPAGLPGLSPPFLGTAVIGSGALTAAVDSYGNVVELRSPGPAGHALIENSLARQRAGSVPSDTGIVVRAGAGATIPLWRARRLGQGYVSDANVIRTVAHVAGASVSVEDAIDPARPHLIRRITVAAGQGERAALGLRINIEGASCTARPRPRLRRVEGVEGDARTTLYWRRRDHVRVTLVCAFGLSAGARPASIAPAAVADRRWLARARPLGAEAPAWARTMYRRSLLVLRALTDRRSGAVAAGLRDGWAYVWPRDSSAVAMALATAGYRREARRIVRFLERLDREAADRFRGDGTPVTDGRELPGDSLGWMRAAARAAGLPPPRGRPVWRDRGDYGERSGDRGDYVANAIAAGVRTAQLRRLFGTRSGLIRRAHDPGSGHDSAAAWGVRPFPRPVLFPLLRRQLRRIAANAGRFGIVPAQDWPGRFPWTAPTAWTAWSLAVLGERGPAMRLLACLRRAATPAGLLPERVSDTTGLPDSTTPLAWSHAFAVLALRALYAPQ